MPHKSVITIGFFDGVHIGHAGLIELLKRTARLYGYKSRILTFDKVTEKLNRGSFKNRLRGLLTPIKEKLEILRSFEIDFIDVIEFDDSFRNLSPEDFFNEYLIKKYGMKKIIVGYDFAFGKDRAGNRHLLKKLCKSDYEMISFYPIFKTDLYTGKDVIVSSSAIRRFIIEGRFRQANELLGRFYSIEGKVEKGMGLGTKLGYPTANIKTEENKLLPMGVFSGYAELDGNVYSAVASIGSRPTFFKDGKQCSEIHLIGYNRKDITKELKFYFFRKLRNEKKFKSINDLKNQISRDIEDARRGYSK